jgi:hypothetical protein
MSDEPTSQLDSYKQVGNSAPTDSYQPGEGKQRIDLDEYYKETGQDEGTVMMQGFEQLSLRKLSKDVARLMDLPNTSSYDPFPSERNARTGAEGFFSAIADRFQVVIEGIIKYIRMAIDWVVDGVKTFFGFRKSARITKAIDDNLEELKEEFAATLKGLGFPVGQYNVENYLGELPAGKSPVLQVMLLKSKMDKDVDSINGLSAALPLLQQAVAKLRQASNSVEQNVRRLKKVIADEHKATMVRKSRGEAISLASSPEVNRVTKAIQEVKAGLDVAPISEIVGKVYEELYKLKFTNEELTEGFDKVRAKLKQTIHTEKLELPPQDIPVIMATIQGLNARYQQISDNELDLSGINWKELGNIVDKSESAKIKDMNDFFNFKSIPTEHQLITEYQRMTIEVRSFTQFCFSVSQALIVVQKQATNLIEWHNRAHAFYYGGVLGDIETMKKSIADAKKNGHKPLVDSKGRPQPLMFIKDADAKTFMEKLSAEFHNYAQADMKNLKEVYNNFTRQIGWGKTV